MGPILGLWPLLEVPTSGLTNADQTVSGFFGSGGSGFSWPAFHAGESLAGNDSLEASSTGSSTTIGDRDSGLGVLLDLLLVRVFAINFLQFKFRSSQWKESTAYKPVAKFSADSKPEVKSNIPMMRFTGFGPRALSKPLICESVEQHQRGGGCGLDLHTGIGPERQAFEKYGIISAVRAAWPAARPAHSFFKFRAYSLNVLPSSLRFLDGNSPADPLIARERRNILPFCPRRRVRNENFS